MILFLFFIYIISIKSLIMLSLICSNLAADIESYMINNSGVKKINLKTLRTSLMKFSDTGFLFAGFCATLRLIGDANGMPNESAQFPCANCARVYSKKNSLTTHLKYECGQPPRFKCPYCILISKKPSNILQHIRRKHKDCMIYVEDIQESSSLFQYNARFYTRP